LIEGIRATSYAALKIDSPAVLAGSFRFAKPAAIVRQAVVVLLCQIRQD
jgi:hypothetical protein